MNLRFLARLRDVRYLKDELRFGHTGIGIASGTYDMVGLPPVRIEGAAVDKIAESLQPCEKTHARPRS